MSLLINNKTKLHATLSTQTELELIWNSENDYMPGTIIELRSKNLRTLVEWRYIKIEIEHADILFRWKVNPTVTEIMKHNGRFFENCEYY